MKRPTRPAALALSAGTAERRTRRAGPETASGGDEQGETFLKDWVIANPGSMIRRAHQIANSIYIEECGDQTTPLHYAVLWRVLHNPGIDQTKLARSVALDRTTTAKIVRHLELKKYLRRRLDSRDRRIKRLFMTPAGANIVDAFTPAIERARARIVEPLSPAERATFMALLSKILRANNEFSRAPLAADVLERLVIDGARKGRPGSKNTRITAHNENELRRAR